MKFLTWTDEVLFQIQRPSSKYNPSHESGFSKELQKYYRLL